MTTNTLTPEERDLFEQVAELPWGVDMLTRILVGSTEGLIDQGALLDAAARGKYAVIVYLYDAVPDERVEAWRTSLGI
jgi:hypothetical protein